jgi:hypothetical protein
MKFGLVVGIILACFLIFINVSKICANSQIIGWDPGLTKKLAAGIHPNSANYFELCPDAVNGKCYGEIPAGKGFYTIANDELCKINSGNNFYLNEYNKNVPCPFEFSWEEDSGDVVADLKIDTTDFTSSITPNIYLGLQENVPYGDVYLGVDQIADINGIDKAHLKFKASYCFGSATDQMDIDSHRRARFLYHIVWYNPVKEKSYGVSINLLDFRQHLNDGSNIGADNYLFYETDETNNCVIQLGGKAWGIIPQDYQPIFDASVNCSFANQANDPWIEVDIPISDILNKLKFEGYLNNDDLNGDITCLIVGGVELWGRLSASMEVKDHYFTVKSLELDCNPDHTDSTGKCHHDCGASAGCHGKTPNTCSSNSLKKCNSTCQEVSSCGDGTCNCGETSTNCSGDCPTINYLPIGTLDQANQTQIAGWVYDQNVGSNPIDVHIYIDNKFAGSTTANQSRSDLVSAGVTPDPNHGFSFSTPFGLSVGKYTINVYAINQPQGTNPELNGSPIVFTISIPDPNPNPLPDPTPDPSPNPTPITYPESTLLKTPDSFKIYVIINQKKKWIPTPEVFETLGYEWTNITIIDKNDLFSIPDYEDNLIRALNDFKVYLIVQGIKRHIPNPEIFLNYGFEWNDIKEVNQETINQYKTSLLIKESKKEEIYYLCPERKIKRWLRSPEIFNSYNNKWEDIQVVSKYEMDSYPESNLIKLYSSNDIYLIEGNKKRLIKTVEEFEREGLDWGKVMGVNGVEFGWFG